VRARARLSDARPTPRVYEMQMHIPPCARRPPLAHNPAFSPRPSSPCTRNCPACPACLSARLPSPASMLTPPPADRPRLHCRAPAGTAMPSPRPPLAPPRPAPPAPPPSAAPPAAKRCLCRRSAAPAPCRAPGMRRTLHPAWPGLNTRLSSAACGGHMPYLRTLRTSRTHASRGCSRPAAQRPRSPRLARPLAQPAP
jgi:hypothetical protein